MRIYEDIWEKNQRARLSKDAKMMLIEIKHFYISSSTPQNGRLCLIAPGSERMKPFKMELQKFENTRLDLAQAEKLFDLPITMYPELQYIQKEMKGLEQIYALYEEQNVSLSALLTLFVTWYF